MANSKRKCSSCKEYVPLVDMKVHGLSALCGECSLAPPKRPNRVYKPRVRTPPRNPMPEGRWQEVMDRDKGTCRSCESQADVVHHCRYRSEDSTPAVHRIENLAALCTDCHLQVHTNKRKYQPLLLAMLWLEYEHGKHVAMFEATAWVEEARGAA